MAKENSIAATGGHLLLPLQRPQYVMVPEALTASLALSLFEVPIAPNSQGLAVALMYSVKQPRTTKKLEFRATEPGPNGPRLAAFADALDAAGFRTVGDREELARAVAMSVRGIRPEKGSSQPASPMTLGLALLQNLRGLQGAENPPRLDRIIEGLFGLGRPINGPSESAAALWIGAIEQRSKVDVISAALDHAVQAALLGGVPVPVPETGLDGTIPWRGMLEGTPFSWLHRTWRRLTGPDWVNALPARVWVDWASTVLRMGLGVGFLWEAAWYETVARSILRGGDDSWDSLRDAVPSTLPWKPESADTSVRDLASVLSWRVRRSDDIRKRLTKWIEDNSSVDKELGGVLRLMADDEVLVGDLVAALSSKSKSGSNLWEAVRYSLQVRDESGPFADHYGLLRSRGRYLLPDPGTEWIAVMASLCCPQPSSQTDLGAVLSSLGELGLVPELGDLVLLLERAGLARGSADADQGVVVESAF